ncbi:hypothetical protein GUJ93_ZPchr0003g17758 [Zizania palustris]|uniref:Uncharacterized protein n=1 Tax=Zizania palustris TaxID=103762 RepID=A0A8J5VDB8_ZIZPA|nr:hypothetical protein GUJ93_ZPchr0003g17758 [Zizania palustris]
MYNGKKRKRKKGSGEGPGLPFSLLPSSCSTGRAAPNHHADDPRLRRCRGRYGGIDIEDDDNDDDDSSESREASVPHQPSIGGYSSCRRTPPHKEVSAEHHGLQDGKVSSSRRIHAPPKGGGGGCRGAEGGVR